MGVLLPEMDRLMRKLLFKFVPLRLIRGQPDLRQLKYDLVENQHPDDMIAFDCEVLKDLLVMDLWKEPTSHMHPASFFQ